MRTMITREVGGALRSDEGAVALVMTVMLFFALLGVGALAVDAGGVYLQRRQLQSAADAAALAGVQDIVSGQSAARASAEHYANLNTSDADAPAFTVDFPRPGTVQVVVNDPDFGLTFARFLPGGQPSTDVGAQATATLSSPSGYGARVVPIGILPETVDAANFNVSTTMKYSPGNEFGPGKFGWTSLREQKITPGGIKQALLDGGVDYEVVLGEVADRPGYSAPAPVDNLQTFIDSDACIGVGAADIDAHFNAVVTVADDGTVVINDPDCKRLVICPVVDGLDTHGTTIVGFAWFFIEATTTQGSDKFITGRFVRPTNPEDLTDWGYYDPHGAVGAPKLVE